MRIQTQMVEHSCGLSLKETCEWCSI